jgi:quercetin 2,3-dioxygenase
VLGGGVVKNEIMAARNATERLILRTTRAGQVVSGFAGPGHTVVEVFGPNNLSATDPFVMLMDDRLDFTPGQPVGEPHPHAGLETVTLMLEGSLDDPSEGLLEEGDLAWMTAGRGIVHNEEVKATGRARILQLWVALPRALRHGDPDFEVAPLRSLPIRREPGVEARLYSGSSGLLVSPTRVRVPITIVDFHLQPDAQVIQAVPGAYSGFFYVVSGSVSVGGARIASGEIGWIDAVAATETDLTLQAESNGARVILYAGKPIAEPLAQRGPFVASSDAEISAFYRDYRAGGFKHISKITAAHRGT